MDATIAYRHNVGAKHARTRAAVLDALNPESGALDNHLFYAVGDLSDDDHSRAKFRARMRCDLIGSGDGLPCVAIVDVTGDVDLTTLCFHDLDVILLGVRFAKFRCDTPANYVADGGRTVLATALSNAIRDWLDETVDGQRMLSLVVDRLPCRVFSSDYLTDQAVPA